MRYNRGRTTSAMKRRLLNLLPALSPLDRENGSTSRDYAGGPSLMVTTSCLPSGVKLVGEPAET